ncbi:hypothetical protein ACBJ59_15080 [Nonomuraea sp. MTCD27]|uniref:hypothetical protein n=1 Tax=Nonomuraea sp. MTCD27 TaxID=1676747 RepID=UPI0035C0D49C
MSEAVLPADTRHDDAMAAGQRSGVLRPAYATAARHLIRLVAPALLVFVPVGLLSLLGLALVVDGSAALVNGAFELIGAPGRPLAVWTAGTLLASLAAQAVVMPATVVLAAGLLAGRPVSTSAALRAAVRCLPAILGLTLLGVVVFAAIVAAGAATLLWDGELLGSFAVMVPLTLLAIPCLLAVPIVALEGRPAGGALKRAYVLACARGHGTGGFWSSAVTLAFGVLVLPALVQQGAQWAASGNQLARGLAGSVLGLVVPAFQATVIARLFLHRLALRGGTAEYGQVVEGLPGSGPGPARPASVLGALLVPGLLYGGTMLVNPLGWLETIETVVTATWSRDRGPEIQADGRPRPTLGGWDLQAVHAGEGARTVMLMDSSAEAKLLTCADSTCDRTRYAWAEPAGVDGDPRAAVARLVGGRLVVATWAQEGNKLEDDDWRARLGLLMCDAAGCVPAPGGKPLAEATHATDDRLVALAPGRYGGLVVAHVRGLPWREGEEDQEVLSITTCEDPACTSPRTKEVARLPSRTSVYQDRGLAVAAGPLDRPSVVRFDGDTGSITVITCADSDCARPRVERPVHGGRPWRRDDHDNQSGATMLLREDTRPLIAYRDSADGSIRLLDCRNPECSQADTVVLSAPGLDHAAPAMVLDRDGRALVAYQDLDRERLVVAACTGTRCTHTPVAKMRHYAGHGLAMALNGEGRPVIAWMDGSPYGGEWHLVVTTPLNLPS